MLPSKRVFEYNVKDCIGTAIPYMSMKSELQEDPAEWHIYNHIAIPLTHAVMRMRARGMPVDPIRRAAMIDEARMRCASLRAELRKVIGDWFEPTNRNHIAKFLFEIRGHQPLGYTKKTHRPKVDKEALITILLEHGAGDPIYDTLTQFLDWDKYCSTFLEGIEPSSNNRIYGYWLVHGTATGRLASREPDLQNLPKEEPRNARRQFVATRGKTFVAADATQLELRLLAYASGCRFLINALEEGKDLHSLTAATNYHIDLSQVTPDKRKVAKGYRYAEVYGAGDEKVQLQMLIKQRIRVALSEVAQMRTSILSQEPEVYQWRERKYAALRQTRQSRNAYGRVRRVFVPDSDLRGIAFNSDIQSTAADYINQVFIALDAQDAPIICQVHDEILLEVPIEETDKWITVIKREFERPQPLYSRQLVLPCDVSVGEVWGQLKKVA